MKVSICITIDPEVKHELEIRHIKNASGLVNDLLKSYLQIKDSDIEYEEQKVLEQLSKKEAEIMQLKEKRDLLIRQKESEVERVKKQIESGELIVIE